MTNQKDRTAQMALILVQGTLLGALVFALSSCGQLLSSATNKNLTVSEKEMQINTYFENQLSTLNELQRTEPDSKVAVGQSNKFKNEVMSKEGKVQGAEECSTQEYDLTKTPEKIIMQNPAAGILYPGALIQGNGYLLGAGGIRELPIRERAPMTIATDLTFEGNSEKMMTVTYATYQEALAKLKSRALKQNVSASANYKYDQVEVHNSEQAALELGFSVKYLGKSLEGNVDAKTSSKEKSYMVAFEHRAFTVSAVAPETASGFFGSDMTVDKLKSLERRGLIGAENPPLYVSSVNYGRLLLFTITSKASQDDIKAALKGAYDVGVTNADVQLKAKYQKIMNESTVKIISWGGEKDDVEALIKSGQIKDYFTSKAGLSGYEPISYVLRNVKDNSIANVSETTKYTVQTCSPVTPLAWKVKITLNKMKFNYTGAYGDRNGEIYGVVALNDYVMWSHTRDDYRQFRKNDEFIFGQDKNSIVAILPVKKPEPVMLKMTLTDNDSGAWWGTDDDIVSAQMRLGYSPDGRITDDGTYAVNDLIKSNVEMTYTIQKIKAIFDPSELK